MPYEPIRFQLPEPTPSLNILLRWHWTKRRKYQQDLACLVLLSLQLAGCHRPRILPRDRRRVVVIRCAPRELDHDNFVGGCKALMDALVSLRLIRDDSSAWLEAKYIQAYAKKGEERTEITIERAAVIGDRSG